MSMIGNVAPGEPADETPAPPAQAADLDKSTGTPADNIPTADDTPASDDPLESALADYFTKQKKEQDTGVHPDRTGTVDTAASQEGEGDGAAPPPAPSDTDDTEDEEEDAPSDTEAGTQQPTTITIGAHSFPADQADNIAQVYQWANSLPPEAVQAIDAVLSGQYELVPKGAAPAPATPPPAPGTPDATGTAAAPPATSINPDDYNDPELAQQIIALQQQIATLTSHTQASVQQQLAQQQRIQMQGALQGAEEFQKQYNLDEQEVLRLGQQVAQLQILPPLLNTIPNPAQAMKMALEQVAWVDPTFRQAQLDAQITASKEAEKDVRKKQTKASSVAGSSGSVPRIAPAATKAERDKQMVRELAEAMEG